MNRLEMLNNAERAGVRVTGIEDERLVVKGSAYVRNLSSEVNWEEIDRESGELKKYNSIISSLGWQWEKHWNVYTEAAPFGLMLSELFQFLRRCINCNGNKPSFIRWGWDAKDFYLTFIEPAGEHRWHRCLSTICFNLNIDDETAEAAGENAIKLISKWDDRILEDNEPFFIKINNQYYLNCDPLCARLLETGIGGSIGGSPRIKFSLIKYIKSLPIILAIYRSRINLKSAEEELNEFNTPETKLRYYSYLFELKIILYALKNFIPFGRGKYDTIETSIDSKHNEQMKKLYPENNVISETKGIAIWEDTGEEIK